VGQRMESEGRACARPVAHSVPDGYLIATILS